MKLPIWITISLLTLLVAAVASAALWRSREVAAVAGGLAQGMWIRTYNMPSGSMRPALEVGDYIFAVTNAFENRIPVRGEVAVYWNSSAGANFVGRIVGLPGDRIQVRDGVLHINDAPVRREQIVDHKPAESDEAFVQYLERLPEGVAHPILEADDNSVLDNTKETIVPPNTVFFMGDNRDNAADGRVYGPTPLKYLKDKPVYIYWSRNWSRIGLAIQ